MKRLTVVLSLAFLVAACASAPLEIPVNRHGLRVVSDVGLYRAIVERDPSQGLVAVTDVVPGAALDIRYATANNFMHEQLYPGPAAYLRCRPALALAAAQRDLASRGLGLKVYDAYRPYSVTERMWERIGNPDYVADPAKGSRHNRGAAVDVTLIDLSTGREIPMPTPYDDFTAAASSTYPDLPVEALRNRSVLRDAMERHGFVVLPSEWWHFDFEGWEQYDLLDMPHSALERPAAVGTACGGPFPS